MFRLKLAFFEKRKDTMQDITDLFLFFPAQYSRWFRRSKREQ